MVPNTKTVTGVDCSADANVNLGFVPDYFILLDATAGSFAQGVPGGNQVETLNAGSTSSITDGVTGYNGSDFAGVFIDKSVFGEISNTGCVLVAVRGEG